MKLHFVVAASHRPITSTLQSGVRNHSDSSQVAVIFPLRDPMINDNNTVHSSAGYSIYMTAFVLLPSAPYTAIIFVLDSTREPLQTKDSNYLLQGTPLCQSILLIVSASSAMMCILGAGRSATRLFEQYTQRSNFSDPAHLVLD